MEPQLFVTDKKELRYEVNPISNRFGIKPNGGLWTSTYNEEYGSDWIRWCISEEISTTENFNGFILYPNKNAKVYVVDSYDDLEKLFKHYELNTGFEYIKGLDFEKIANDYDGIHLTEEGKWRTRLTYPYNLRSWNCECTLWFRWVFDKVERYFYEKGGK